MTVSRLTIATSARRKILRTGANTSAGFERYERIGSSNITSPPKANVTGSPLPSRFGRTGSTSGVVGAATVFVAVTAWIVEAFGAAADAPTESEPPHAAVTIATKTQHNRHKTRLRIHPLFMRFPRDPCTGTLLAVKIEE